MRRFLLALGLVALSAQAQVQLQLEFDRQKQFIVGEKCEVAVRIVNYTGGVLPLGGKPDWLRLSMEEVSGGFVPHAADLPTIGDFTLQPSTRGTVRYNLTPAFRMDHPGRYLIQGSLIDPTSGDTIVSQPAECEVMNGVVLWEQLYFQPTSLTNAPQRRRYSLLQANFYQKSQLYFRMSDETGLQVYNVLQLGPIVNFEKQTQIIDRQTRLHVLHRVGSQEYLYHLFKPDGSLESRKLYLISGQRGPELRVNDDGEVAVIGGVRRESPADFQAVTGKPPAPSIVNENDSKPPKS
ncbi:MAG TPA: hypothetical protein VMF06_17725 [Candidatus Limnocylindria bacterium]|nr:hypothetical protein [Candidatus Limnocylindria bacterium]